MDPRRNPYAPGAGAPPPELAGRDALNPGTRKRLCDDVAAAAGFLGVGGDGFVREAGTRVASKAIICAKQATRLHGGVMDARPSAIRCAVWISAVAVVLTA